MPSNPNSNTPRRRPLRRLAIVTRELATSIGRRITLAQASAVAGIMGAIAAMVGLTATLGVPSPFRNRNETTNTLKLASSQVTGLKIAQIG